jgi:hypothetical protein
MNFWALIAGGYVLLFLGIVIGDKCNFTGAIILFSIGLIIKAKGNKQ